MFRPVFLSHVNDPDTTPLFPGDPPFTLTAVHAEGYYLQRVDQGEHTGTHWGAPVHFDPDGRAADQLDATDLCRPAVVVDVREQAAADPDHAVTVAELQAFEVSHGRIPDGAAVLLWTGWDTRWGTPAYANADASGTPHQPGFSVAAVRWLLDTGRLGRQGALGTDTFGPDPGADPTYAVSRLLYGEHRITLENLAHLDRMPPAGAWVLAGGVRNRGGSGSPATVYGLIPDRA
ncbi:cyclase family protein [Spirilliplanes yamanashiensis]|uniref:Cyclase n=1 Tax=Spirilliplanes yamanashiensis TaxID=42233 RepID=A0A8J3YC85_9ACTN|nr:cyclase family protein [Spirilliplanes yamanashiensis]MDP9818773.1 kynurenine formamidase [Spirilliplanes yamanashiensis]GIJ05227.1 cyclase [Spirilliplanes yamanashiensis]